MNKKREKVVKDKVYEIYTEEEEEEEEDEEEEEEEGVPFQLSLPSPS